MNYNAAKKWSSNLYIDDMEDARWSDEGDYSLNAGVLVLGFLASCV